MTSSANVGESSGSSESRRAPACARSDAIAQTTDWFTSSQKANAVGQSRRCLIRCATKKHRCPSVRYLQRLGFALATHELELPRRDQLAHQFALRRALLASARRSTSPPTRATPAWPDVWV